MDHEVSTVHSEVHTGGYVQPVYTGYTHPGITGGDTHHRVYNRRGYPPPGV